MKALRWTLWVLGGLLGLIVAAGVAVALLFDPNRYKPELVALVKQTTGRTLEVQGDMRLRLFPKIGASAGKVSLSEANSPRSFARIDEAQVAVALLPLLRGEMIVDQVELRGLQAEFVKHKDGTTNVDDLIHRQRNAPEPSAGSAPAAGGAARSLQLQVSGISVRDAQIIWKDEAAGESLKLSVESLTTGRIAEDEPGKVQAVIRLEGARPALDLSVSATVPYRASFRSRSFTLTGVQLKAEGDAFGERGILATLAADASIDAAASRVELSRFSSDLRVKGSDLAVRGDGRFDWGSGAASASASATLDGSTAKLRVDIADLAKRQFHFELTADHLDVDRYLPKRPHGETAAASNPAPGSTPNPAPGSTSSPSGRSASGRPQAPADDQPIDFAVLKPLNGSGTVSIGSLVVDGLKADTVRATVAASGGRLDLNPVSANLYQGRLNAAIHVDADARSIELHALLAGVALGPLLKDLTDKDVLQGVATVQMDVNGAGATVNALKGTLAGKASLAVRDGAVKGINLGAIARNAGALLGTKGLQDVTASSSDQTDFSELTATFVIRNGVAHNSDLAARSPFLRLSGAGDIDIVRSRLDYQAKAAIVAAAAGQGAKDSSTGGVTIPVRVSGPFNQLRYQVDAQSVLLDAAKSQANQRLQDALKNRVPQELQGPVGDALKGLLGR